VYETVNAGDPILRFCDIVGGYHDADTGQDLFKKGQINGLTPPGVNENNVVVDPLFKDGSEPLLRFGLKASSTLLHGGDPDPQFNNRDGTRCDIGATGGPHSSTLPLVCAGDSFLRGKFRRVPPSGVDAALNIAAPPLDTSSRLAQDFTGDARPDLLVQ